jgi:ZIP family zinc transporter
MQGLSEPVGALVALIFIKPYLTPLRLQLMLAFVGGISALSLFRLHDRRMC